MQSPPDTYPITGVCVVADPTKCPAGYEIIFRSHDKRDDCDLWKDGFFRTRVSRYLCFTRVFPLEGGRLNNVMCDIVIQNDRDVPPDGFSLIDFTVDTREKATSKKQICVKLMPRDTAVESICDLMILSRQKRPPSGYTLVGEVNGLLVCFKMGIVPEDTKHTVPSASPALPSPTSANHVPRAPVNNAHTAVPSVVNSSTLLRQESFFLTQTALSGVPFQLHPRLQNTGNLNDNEVPTVSFRSFVDIDNEYSYPFRIERTACAQSDE